MTEPPNESTPSESNPNEPYGTNPTPGQPQYGQPQYGQPAPGQPQYGQPDLSKPSTGQPPTGQPQYGQPPTGQPQYGQPQYGQPQYGQPQYGQPPTGQPQYGQPPTGQPQYGQPQYGQPQPGSVPPGGTPPPGQFGAAPGYPAAPAPGAPGTPFSVGESFSWAWSQFKAKPGPMILPGVIMALVALVFWSLIVWGSSLYTTTTTETLGGSEYGGTSYSYETTSISAGGLAAFIAIYIIGLLILLYIEAAILSGAVRVANGESVDAKSFLVPIRFGPVIGTAILVGLITGVASLCIGIGGLIAGLLLQFAVLATISEGKSPGDAITRSFRVTTNRIGDSILTLIIVWLTNLVGALICGIGLIVSAPLAALFQVHAFRRIVNEPIAPPAP